MAGGWNPLAVNCDRRVTALPGTAQTWKCYIFAADDRRITRHLPGLLADGWKISCSDAPHAARIPA